MADEMSKSNDDQNRSSLTSSTDDMETLSLNSEAQTDEQSSVTKTRYAFNDECMNSGSTVPMNGGVGFGLVGMIGPNANGPGDTDSKKSQAQNSTPKIIPDIQDKFREKQTFLPNNFPSIIRLNVGGTKFMTRLSTLRKYPDSMLSAMFSERHEIDKDEEGNYFIDSDGEHFKYIISYLRHEDLPPNSVALEVYKIALYFGIHDLVMKLQSAPAVARLLVLETHRSQFPKYYEIKNKVIQCAMANAVTSKCGDVIIYASKTDGHPRYPQFNNHTGCVIDTAHVRAGPWTTSVDEDSLIRCLENDLIDDGFNVRTKMSKTRCKFYYAGMTCPHYVFRLQINFGPAVA